MRRGRYFLGRVVKINLSQDDLMNAICNAPTLQSGKYNWTITDILDRRNEELKYVFGTLSKYAKDGQARVIDEIHRNQVAADIPNLLEASSPFIYLPEHSGIAYLHVWNGIPENVFQRRFKSIIELCFNNFFVECNIDSIANYKQFASRLKKLDTFTEISAKVYPPNPLFGRLWGSLNDYIKTRNASEISVKEQTSKPEGLKTNIVELMENIITSSEYEPESVTAITDAAILMAADGYGNGKVIGLENGEEIIIRTSDSHTSFLFTKDPTASELAKAALRQFEKIAIDRDMKH